MIDPFENETEFELKCVGNDAKIEVVCEEETFIYKLNNEIVDLNVACSKPPGSIK